jgi:hypothetical protein
MFNKHLFALLVMSKEYLKRAVPGQKRNWWAFGFLIFMVIGMSSSFVFFGFNDGSKVTYNGHRFLYKGDHWEVKVNGVIAATTYAPEQVMSIEVPTELPTLLQNKVQIDATSDMNDSMKDWVSLAEFQMGLTLAAGSVYLRTGYLQNGTQFPQISCEKASSFVPVIYFRSSNETKATIQGSCIIAEARSGQEMALLKDRLLYAMLGLDKQK